MVQYLGFSGSPGSASAAGSAFNPASSPRRVIRQNPKDFAASLQPGQYTGINVKLTDLGHLSLAGENHLFSGQAFGMDPHGKRVAYDSHESIGLYVKPGLTSDQLARARGFVQEYYEGLDDNTMSHAGDAPVTLARPSEETTPFWGPGDYTGLNAPKSDHVRYNQALENGLVPGAPVPAANSTRTVGDLARMGVVGLYVDPNLKDEYALTRANRYIQSQATDNCPLGDMARRRDTVMRLG